MLYVATENSMLMLSRDRYTFYSYIYPQNSMICSGVQDYLLKFRHFFTISEICKMMDGQVGRPGEAAV